jgi:hypothetical protein
MDSKGGIFSTPSRARLLGLSQPYGGEYAENKKRTFWDRVTKYTKTALIDLALFFETAPKEEVKKAIQFDLVYNLINSYFNIEFDHAFADLDVDKVRIANLMIERAFYYLTSPPVKHLIASYELPHINHGVEVAENVSGRLISYLKYEEESS